MQIDFKPVSKQTTHQHHHTPCNRPSHHPCGLWCMLVYVCLPGCVCCPVSRQYTARQTYTSMHHDPQGNTHSQADVHQHAHRATHTARQTYTSMHHDPQGNTHSQADVRTPACIATHRATHTARQTYVHQHASRPTGQHTQPGRRTPACPQGNTHSQADVRTPACIATHRATHTARQTYTSMPTGQHTQPGRRTYTSMHRDPQGNTHSQADVRTPACITTHRSQAVHQHA